MGILVRIRDWLTGKKTSKPELDAERAEAGLNLSNVDSDPRTTQALMDELGIRSRLDDDDDATRDRNAA